MLPCCILVDLLFPPQNDHSSQGLRTVSSFAKMDAIPSELSPPQLFYIMVMCLRALAVQAGVFMSPADLAWEQANPNGSSGPAGCTIGDNSTLGTALQCVEISDSDEEQDPNVKQTESARGGAVEGPKEPPYPPPSRRRQRSSSSSRGDSRTKKARK